MLAAGGPDPAGGSGTSTCPSRPLDARSQLPARGGPGPPRVPHRGRGRESSTRSSPTYCVKCKWLKRAQAPLRTGQPLSDNTIARLLLR